MNPAPAKINLEIQRGATFQAVPFRLWADKKKGIRFNGTGYSLFCQARYPDGTLAFAFNPAWTSAADGEGEWPEVSKETVLTTIPEGKFAFDVVLQDADGKRPPRIILGEINAFTLHTQPPES